MRIRLVPPLAAAASALVAFPAVALAQQDGVGGQTEPPRRGEAVLDRARPDFDPAGVRAGAFLVFPSLAVDGTYDDNIFATPRDTVSDWITQFRPEVRVRSDWVRHALTLRAGGIFGLYADNDREDYEDLFLLGEGRLDILRGTTATFGGGYERLHEERGSPNDVGGAEPVEYDRWQARVELERAVSRFQVRGGASIETYGFDNVTAPGGAVIRQDDRDRDVYGTYLRLGYEVSPNLLGFVRGSYNWRRYSVATVRDSDGYQIDGGVAVDFGGITTGEAYVGYREQEYDDPAFAPVDGFTYGARILWNPTPLTSVRFAVVDEIEETILLGSSAYEATTYSVDADHELLRNLILGVGAAFRQEDFQQIDRSDDFTRLRISAKYLLNRNFDIEVGYNYDSRSSNQPGRDYDVNRFFVSFTAAL